MKYYFSGFSCSDELYHFGIPGQKWYVRRFQNPDGTLTAEGRVRYRGVSESTDTGGSGGTSRAHYKANEVGNAISNTAKKTGQAIGKVAKTAAKYEVDKFKRHHPWMMNDEELNSALDKANKIDRFTKTRKDIRDRSGYGKVTNIIYNALDRATSNLAGEVATNIGRKFVNDKIESEKESRENKKHRLSNRLRREFQEDFSKRWRNGNAPNIEELENANTYLDALRSIEDPKPNNGGGGGKKKKKQQEGGGN